MEGLFAKALFMYGTAQTFYSPTHALLFANGACFLATAGAFFATNTNKSLYDRWHPLGLHLVPGRRPILPCVLDPFSGPDAANRASRALGDVSRSQSHFAATAGSSCGDRACFCEFVIAGSMSCTA